MVLSRRWLKDYVNLDDISDKEFCDEMTLSGSKVEEFKKEGSELENIVVGQIKSLERHPDSDHLWICKVDVGGESDEQIVTGAQNLSIGDYVPAALPGATVYNRKDHCIEKIKKGKLRGIESNGMLCSFDELGLTQNDFPYATADGIFILGDDCDHTPGEDIRKAIGYDDNCVEFEITSNRCDCMSVTGLAREAAATFDRDFVLKAPVVKPGHGDVNEMLKVNIAEPDKCYRYTGAVVENVRVKESPRWLRERLRASGVRPISNIVDITNYVMEEYGQPMHAYDLDTIEGKEITQYFGIVSGETIIGANVFKDFFAGIRDIVGGRAGSYESVLREAKETALKEMSDHAARMGANAVIAVDLDYETVGGSGSMLMVTAAGTAVRYQ